MSETRVSTALTIFLGALLVVPVAGFLIAVGPSRYSLGIPFPDIVVIWGGGAVLAYIVLRIKERADNAEAASRAKDLEELNKLWVLDRDSLRLVLYDGREIPYVMSYEPPPAELLEEAKPEGDRLVVHVPADSFVRFVWKRRETAPPDAPAPPA